MESWINFLFTVCVCFLCLDPNRVVSGTQWESPYAVLQNAADGDTLRPRGRVSVSPGSDESCEVSDYPLRGPVGGRVKHVIMQNSTKRTSPRCHFPFNLLSEPLPSAFSLSLSSSHSLLSITSWLPPPIWQN